MEQFEELIKKVREDASYAKGIVENIDKVTSDYNLSEDQVKHLLSEAKKGRVKSTNFRKDDLGSVIVYISVTVALVFFIVFSILNPDKKILGIPSWNNWNGFLKGLVIFYGVVFLSVTLRLIVKQFIVMPKFKRGPVFIFFTLFVIVPLFLGILSFEHEVQLKVLFAVLMVIFTLLPISFYPLFVLNKVRALWEEFIFNFKNLDPFYNDDLQNIYKNKYESIYGPVDSNSITLYKLKLSNENYFPVILNAIIISLGWFLYFFVEPGTNGTNSGLLEIGGESPFVFGFLGAYLYSLEMLFRRYFQSDLKATAYSNSSHRILVTWVLALVLIIIPIDFLAKSSGEEVVTALPNEIACVLTFVVGVFPNVAWQVINRAIKWFLGLRISSFKQDNPLHKIDGVTIWVESRLLEQGIENIQNLVTTNIVDLILQTNLDPRRIVDWIDQGLLLLHLSKNKELKDELDKRGINRGTDLLQNYEEHKKERALKPDKFFISQKFDEQIKPIVISIDNDPNIYHIKSWRKIKLKLNKKLDDLELNIIKKGKEYDMELVEE